MNMDMNLDDFKRSTFSMSGPPDIDIDTETDVIFSAKRQKLDTSLNNNNSEGTGLLFDLKLSDNVTNKSVNAISTSNSSSNNNTDDRNSVFSFNIFNTGKQMCEQKETSNSINDSLLKSNIKTTTPLINENYDIINNGSSQSNLPTFRKEISHSTTNNNTTSILNNKNEELNSKQLPEKKFEPSNLNEISDDRDEIHTDEPVADKTDCQLKENSTLQPNSSINRDTNKDNSSVKDTSNINKDTNNINNDTNNINKDTSNINKDTSNINKDTSNINKDTNNINKDTNNINKDTSNISKDTNNINKDTSTINKDTSNINKDTSNINKDTSNINKDTSNINKDTSNINKDTSNISKDKTSLSSSSHALSVSSIESNEDKNTIQNKSTDQNQTDNNRHENQQFTVKRNQTFSVSTLNDSNDQPVGELNKLPIQTTKYKLSEDIKSTKFNNHIATMDQHITTVDQEKQNEDKNQAVTIQSKLTSINKRYKPTLSSETSLNSSKQSLWSSDKFIETKKTFKTIDFETKSSTQKYYDFSQLKTNQSKASKKQEQTTSKASTNLFPSNNLQLNERDQINQFKLLHSKMNNVTGETDVKHLNTNTKLNKNPIDNIKSHPKFYNNNHYSEKINDISIQNNRNRRNSIQLPQQDDKQESSNAYSKQQQNNNHQQINEQHRKMSKQVEKFPILNDTNTKQAEPNFKYLEHLKKSNNNDNDIQLSTLPTVKRVGIQSQRVMPKKMIDFRNFMNVTPKTSSLLPTLPPKSTNYLKPMSTFTHKISETDLNQRIQRYEETCKNSVEMIDRLVTTYDELVLQGEQEHQAFQRSLEEALDIQVNVADLRNEVLIMAHRSKINDTFDKVDHVLSQAKHTIARLSSQITNSD